MHISAPPSLRYKSRNRGRESTFLVSFSAFHFSVSAKQIKKHLGISTDLVFSKKHNIDNADIAHCLLVLYCKQNENDFSKMVFQHSCFLAYSPW